MFVAEIACVGFTRCNETANAAGRGAEKCDFIGKYENSERQNGPIFCNEKCHFCGYFVAEFCDGISPEFTILVPYGYKTGVHSTRTFDTFWNPPAHGRIHALFLIPELVPVMITASFIQGEQVAQALVGPKLSRSLEAALFLPTG